MKGYRTLIWFMFLCVAKMVEPEFYWNWLTVVVVICAMLWLMVLDIMELSVPSTIIVPVNQDDQV